MARIHFDFLGLVALYSYAVLAVHTFTVSNRCPIDITWYIGESNQGTLTPTSSATIQLDNRFSSFIFTTANGGSVKGRGTTRAGFNGWGGYYYIISNPTVRFNTGIAILPTLCAILYCDDNPSCPFTFSSEPLAFTQPPSPPLFQCPDPPVSPVSYQIIFCPSASFPQENPPATIHPNGNPNKCLDLLGNKRTSGQPIQIFDCNGSGAQRWRINASKTQIRLEYTDFCIGAGSPNPSNGAHMVLQPCSSPSTQWVYNADDSIQWSGSNQCLDLTNGDLTNGNPVQAWICTTGNTHQIWTLGTAL